MKAILITFFMLFAVSSFAQTNIIVTPQRPVTCVFENHSNVNWIYEIQTIDETEDEVTFQFKSQHGFCQNGRLVSYQIDPKWAMVGLWQESVQWPWQKDAYEAKVFGSTISEVIVLLKFNKTRLFKKRADRHFDMGFYPFGFMNSYRYGWNVDVFLSPDGETTFSIR